MKILENYGLSAVPDFPGQNEIDAPYLPISWTEEFSECNIEILIGELNKLNNPKTILEIGTAKTVPGSTYSLLFEKDDETFYFGVDLLDRSYIEGENINMIKADSSETNTIMKIIKEKTGSYNIDLLHIDGHHSVNQVKKDWKFAQFVTENGVILMHDTNAHRGPIKLLECLDTNIYDFKKYCDNNADWGITVIKRKKI